MKKTLHLSLYNHSSKEVIKKNRTGSLKHYSHTFYVWLMELEFLSTTDILSDFFWFDFFCSKMKSLD